MAPNYPTAEEFPISLGIVRSPLQALTGRAPSYRLEGLNLSKEIISELETKEELIIVTWVQEEVVDEVDKYVLDQFLVTLPSLLFPRG